MRYLLAILVISIIFITACSKNSAQQSTEDLAKELQKQGDDNMASLKVSSPAFASKASIPARFTCDGANVSPELHIEGIPKDSKSLVLIVDDPDAPSGTWTHWVVFDIPPNTSIIDQDSVPGVQGLNDFKVTDYRGPCPPSGSHRYFFRVFALDAKLNLNRGASRKSVEAAMKGHVVAQGELYGVYQRKSA